MKKKAILNVMINKFNQYIQGLRKNYESIVITHNKMNYAVIYSQPLL